MPVCSCDGHFEATFDNRSDFAYSGVKLKALTSCSVEYAG
jgi:hypothetical protein